ncbi:MAG: hypothetical protein ACPG7F_18315, partial [Aggregatilineales bacterium]
TPIQHISMIVSLGFFVIVIGMLYQGRRVQSAPPVLSESLSSYIAGSIVVGLFGFGLLFMTVLHPAGVFEVESDPENPVYMQTDVGVVFGETIELSGYTLDWQRIAAGQRREITLYWTAAEDITENYRPIVQLINLQRDAAYAVSEPLFPSGGSTQVMNADNFMSDTHVLTLFPDVSPYVGQLSVQMLSQATGDPLLLPDGSDRVMLDPIIQIDGTGVQSDNQLEVQIADIAELYCAAFSIDGEQINVDATWHLTGTTEENLVVLVHGLDTDGNLVEQGDSAFFDGNYSARYWQSGQILRDSYMLPDNPDMAQIALGVYLRRDPAIRLSMTQNNQALLDNRLLLPLEENSCSQ